MGLKGHRLTLHDRGSDHVHQWKPLCSCGWIGVQRRRRQEAEGQYRDHVHRCENEAKKARRRGGRPPTPGECTPSDALPDQLRQPA